MAKKMSRSIKAVPVADKESLFICTSDSKIHKIDMKNGKILKSLKVDIPSYGMPVMVNGELYIGTRQIVSVDPDFDKVGSLYKINAETNEIIWRCRISPNYRENFFKHFVKDMGASSELQILAAHDVWERVSSVEKRFWHERDATSRKQTIEYAQKHVSRYRYLRSEAQEKGVAPYLWMKILKKDREEWANLTREEKDELLAKAEEKLVEEKKRKKSS